MFANATAGEIFGMDPEELQNKKFSDFVDQDELSAIRAQRNTCRRSGRCTFEFGITLESGEKKTILATATPRRDDKGGVIGTFEVFRDITDRKRTEILKARLAAKSEFLTMISHELRTPLVPIIGYAELLLSSTFGDLPEDCKEPLETIYSRAEALKALIDDILEINRMERGILDVKLTGVDARAMLEETVKPYNEISQSKPVDISVECEEFSILADPDRIRQVIQNLMGNSIKYSGDSVRITIKGQVKDSKGCISVEDNGMGMSKEEMPYIFERFYQIEDIHNRTHEGAGLGLAIARELVEKMGGTISVESEQGNGSTFTICMELADEEVPDVKLDEVIVMPPEAPVAREESVIEKRDRILVIDDDEFNVRLLEKMLEEDYDVETASTGSEGLEVIRGGKGFELVLLDWMMPGMDGLSLLVAIKADRSTKDIPVIFVSGKTEPEVIEKGMSAGASGFIAKPYNRDEILDSIRLAIEESRTTSPRDS
jgi:PAS domain S-box-containing protein